MNGERGFYLFLIVLGIVSLTLLGLFFYKILDIKTELISFSPTSSSFSGNVVNFDAIIDGDYDTYATCLKDMGYDPSPQQSARYFAIGFIDKNDTVNSAATTNGAAACSGDFSYAGGKSVGGVVALTANLTAITTAGVSTGGNAFVAGALGPVDAALTTPDKQSTWSIDQNKFVKKINEGY